MAVSAMQVVQDTVGFGGVGISEIEARMRYMKAFGDLPSETVIYDPWRPMVPGKVDSGPFTLHKALGTYHRKVFEKMQKAFTFGSQASTLLPVYVDPDIIRLLYEETPFLSLVRRVTNKGRTADYNQITALSNAQWHQEDAELAEADDTYVRQSKPIKFGYAVGRMTGPAVAAMKEYADAANLEVQNKTISLRLKEQQTSIQGEAAATPTDADVYVADADGYDGLIKSITTNATDLTGGDITTAALRTAIRQANEAGGRPNLILMQSETLQTFKELMTTRVHYDSVQIGTLQYGFQGLVFDGIPVLEMAIHMPTATDKKVVLVLDMRVIEMRVLQDVMMEELAKTNDSDKFMVKVYETLICKAEKFCSKIINVD